MKKKSKKISETFKELGIKVNSSGTKQEWKTLPNIYHLTRILIGLEEIGECTVGKLALELGMNKITCKKGLIWLSSHNLVEVKKDTRSVNMYKIKRENEK